jgi:hypothetical protein
MVKSDFDCKLPSKKLLVNVQHTQNFGIARAVYSKGCTLLSVAGINRSMANPKLPQHSKALPHTRRHISTRSQYVVTEHVGG